MTKYDLIFMSVRSLWRRKLRSCLTILGVLIGTSSIVLMVSLALAMNQNYKNQINQWGALTLVDVTQQDTMDDLLEVEILDDEAVAIMAQLPNIEKVMPRIETSATLTIGQYGTMRAITIIGYDADELEAIGYTAEQGRNYEEGEENVILAGGKLAEQLVKKGQQVNKMTGSSRNNSRQGMGGMPGGMPGGMSGDNSFRLPSGGNRSNAGGMPNGGGMPGGMMIPPDMMPGEIQGNQSQGSESEIDFFNDRVSITFETFSFKTANNMFANGSESNSTTSSPKPITMEIVGVLPSGNTDTDSYIFMPRETVLKLIKQKAIYDAKQNGATPDTTIESYKSVKVKVTNSDNVTFSQRQIEALGFVASGAQDTLDEMQNMSSSIQIILMGIGAISLVVAAIGITNTMMMSIYERTREIGVMKVIGAVISDIKQMFLVEAAMIGFMGGVFGVLMCYGISWFLNHYAVDFFGDLVGTSNAYETYVSIISLELAGASILFATIIGLVAGYMPAKRATALSALTAIKTD